MMKFNIDEFESSLKEELEVFVRDWKANASENSNMYPSELTIGEWEEQFAMYLETK